VANATPVTSGSIPDSASSAGAINASVTAEQRKGKTVTKLDKGPNKDPNTEAYLPATYELQTTVPFVGAVAIIRTDN
jgi:hypothetical protein